MVGGDRLEHRRPRSTGDETSAARTVGEIIGLAFHVAAIAFLVLARKEFWAKVRRGALLKAAAALVAGMAVGIADRLGAAGALPRHAGPRRPVLATRSTGSAAFAGAGADAFSRPSARLRQRAARPVRRAGPDGRRDRAVPVAARRERAHRRGRIGDPRPAGALRQERLAGLLRHPPRQGRGVRPERPRRDHLPRRGRRLPGQRRPDRRPEGVAAGHRGVAAAVPGLRLGARRDGRQFGCAHRPSARPGLNALQLGDEAILYPDKLPAVRARTCARCARR